jgi:hypothetical protein
MSDNPIRSCTVDSLPVRDLRERGGARPRRRGRHGGSCAAAIAARGEANVILATGNSQLAFLRALRAEPTIDWDARAGVPHGRVRGHRPEHRASFPRFLRGAPPRSTCACAEFFPMAGDPDRVEAICRAYEEALRAVPRRRRRARLGRERPPGVQRPALRRLRRPGLGQAGAARRGEPRAAAWRGALRQPRRGPDPRDHAHHPGAAGGQARAVHRPRGAQGGGGARLPARAVSEDRPGRSSAPSARHALPRPGLGGARSEHPRAPERGGHHGGPDEGHRQPPLREPLLPRPPPSSASLARGGTFAHAYTPQPLCVPARVSLWTGRWPHAHGARLNETPMPPGERHAFRSGTRPATSSA